MNAEIAATRVSAEQAQAQQNRYSWAMEQQARRVEAPADVMYDKWKEIIPQEQYGIVDAVSAQASFTKGFRESLIAGTHDRFISEVYYTDVMNATLGLPSVYSGIYRILNPNPQTDKDKLVVRNHTHEYLTGIRAQLDGFVAEAEASGMPQPYITEYAARANEERQLTLAAEALGTTGFTRLHKTPEQWGRFIDVEASKAAGSVVLPFEQEAMAILLINKLNPPKEDVSIHNALKAWNLDEEESAYVGVSEIPADAKLLPHENYKKLFEVAIKRVGFDKLGWTVEITDTVSATSCEASEKKIKIAQGEDITAFFTHYIAKHELGHMIRGGNGLGQGYKLLATGVEEYPLAEEGAGAAYELIAGEPFGHSRQVELAGRYTMISMSLKTEVVDGVVRPKYTPQEIFDTMVGLGMDPEVVASNMWRNQRGTSLQHQVITIDVEHNGQAFQLPAAETFTKDTIYFEGQMQQFNWIKQHMPIREGDRTDLTVDAVDFSHEVLPVVGHGRLHMEDIRLQPTWNQAQADRLRQEIAELGRETLYDVFQLHGGGKYRIDFVKEGSLWLDLLNFSEKGGMTEYKRLLNPKEIESVA